MKKSPWWMTMVGLFLAATIVWAVPGFTQEQGGGSPKGSSLLHKSGLSSGPGSCDTGNTSNSTSQTSPSYKIGEKSQGQEKNQPSEKKNSLTPANPNTQPQTQTPGGTKVP